MARFIHVNLVHLHVFLLYFQEKSTKTIEKLIFTHDFDTTLSTIRQAEKGVYQKRKRM